MSHNFRHLLIPMRFLLLPHSFLLSDHVCSPNRLLSHLRNHSFRNFHLFCLPDNKDLYSVLFLYRLLILQAHLHFLFPYQLQPMSSPHKMEVHQRNASINQIRLIRTLSCQCYRSKVQMLPRASGHRPPEHTCMLRLLLLLYLPQTH